MFSFEDNRYNRQINMPEWGADRQERLKDATVAVIGAGGVKSTLLMALVAAGIGHIRIIEFDRVEESNLNRQILYRSSDIGTHKGCAALKTLQDLNPTIDISLIEEKLTEANIETLLTGYEFIAEGGDSPYARNIVNRYCLRTGKPMVHTSAQFSYGYVFSMLPGTACFACLFLNDHSRREHTGPVPVNVLSTSVAGTLGAAEVLRYFLGYKDKMFTNRRLIFSSLLLSSEFKIQPVPRIENCPACSSLDANYDA